MKTNELRETYLDFFQSKGCVRKPSDLLVPANDNSVLFTPAGMNQFKEQFLGIGKLEYTRATTCQKCIRTGDIENVGKTRFHMTFFEMLGNFSFGDYFKRDAIHWAWELVTKTLQIAGERLRVTVYQDDDEAYNIWRDEIKVPAKFIRRCGEDDNFWPASAPTQGPDGVCGPCSEIYVDLGADGEVEIWNLVFTQFNRVGPPPNNLHPLPKKNIDTGMGLERTAAVLQGVPTNFDIDIFRPIVAAAEEIVGVKYDPLNDLPAAQRLRRIAEHARTVLFCMHENIQPGPAKQGYVVRRLLRRALVDAYRMGRKEPTLHLLVPTIVEQMRAAYPELAGNAESVARQMAAEEQRFLDTVEGGLAYLDGVFRKLPAGGVMPGKEAFQLHATFGFPIELTEELASGRNLHVDRKQFDVAMEEHQKVSNVGGGGPVFTVGPIQKLKESGTPPTKFVGYEQSSTSAVVQAVIADGKLVEQPIGAEHSGLIALVLDTTPFYGESGGQVGDTGTIAVDGFLFEVTDTRKTDGYFQHLGRVRQGRASVGLKATATIHADRRAGIQRAHSATHILHAGLHKVLGEHAKQAGSKVERDVLRFDFSHSSAMSAEEIEQVEQFAAERIMEAAPITAEIKPIAEARKMGATALFGEKYGDEVRIISMGGFSREFCGGCHLSNTGQVGPLRLVREESVSAGVRRITALTGPAAIEHQRKQEKLLHEAAALLRAPPTDLPKRIEALQREVKDLQRSASQKKQSESGDLIARLIAEGTKIGEATVIVGAIDGSSPDALREICDAMRGKVKTVAVLLASAEADKANLVASVSKELQGRLKAGDWIRDVAAVVDGKGGGRPDLAQAGGKNPAKIPEALVKAREWAAAKLGG